MNSELDDDNLRIGINRSERVSATKENYIRKERRRTSMSRRIRLVNAYLNKINAKPEEGACRAL
ncbi:MAG: hypothetical protein LBC13_02155 [Clostridiales bacterium]|nr:hypothetical protein [Clostridiales bacterium]